MTGRPPYPFRELNRDARIQVVLAERGHKILEQLGDVAPRDGDFRVRYGGPGPSHAVLDPVTGEVLHLGDVLAANVSSFLESCVVRLEQVVVNLCSDGVVAEGLVRAVPQGFREEYLVQGRTSWATKSCTLGSCTFLPPPALRIVLTAATKAGSKSSSKNQSFSWHAEQKPCMPCSTILVATSCQGSLTKSPSFAGLAAL
eukprot:CAMPEP_0168683382 /NCGR_PEP_ID=MMETSP0503-20121227/28270_1 /TAXON_ID=89963 /ORGANISM="Heterocapsa rotundata, Strain SCCAP K-0483" /LENGTH=199 /DNA_ID=CAMNT_0008728035 /DNA_START=100 /DNA_END=698 /DNA_ORIENTATION=-